MFNKKVGQGQPSCFSRKARKRVWSSCENHLRFFRGAQKKGISAIVATVLIILITVAAVTIVWAAIIPMIKTNLEMGTACLEADVLIDSGSGYTCYDADKKILAVQIKKGPNEVDIAEVELLLGSGGTSSKMSMPFDLKSNAGKVFYFLADEDVDEVSIAPVIKMGNSEKTCDITAKVKLKSCSLDSKVNLNLIFSDSLIPLINSDSWTEGTGSATGYTRNGLDSENVREWGIGPHGNNVLLWKAIPDSISNADGGWNGATFPIDHTKTYRVAVWIKKTGSSDGTTYFGILGSQVTHLGGAVQTNPYFFCGDLPELDKWYLLVGYIHGSGDSTTDKYGGIYDGKTGEKVWSITGDGNCNSEYKFTTSATTQRHRAYLYYDTTTSDRQYFWNPTFMEVSDYELPLEIE